MVEADGKCSLTTSGSPSAWDLLTDDQRQEMYWLCARIMGARLLELGVQPKDRLATIASAVLKPDSRLLTQNVDTGSMPTQDTAGQWSARITSTYVQQQHSITSLVVEDMPRVTRLDRIYHAIQDDDDFQHLREYAEFVPGEGPWPNPAAMIIGEAPGANEDRLKRPFVGQAGNFLENSMWDAGLKRNDVFITNVVKYRPPNNRTPTWEEIELAIPHLRKEVVAVLPHGGLVILLGAVPLYVVDPELRISDVHGEPFESGQWTFVPMYHPAYVMRKRKDMIESYRKDWAKIKELRAA